MGLVSGRVGNNGVAYTDPPGPRITLLWRFFAVCFDFPFFWSCFPEPLRGSEFGVALRYFDKQLVGFQAELSYVEAGWRENISDSLTSLYERSTSYVELQILTQFSVGKGAVQPMLQAGPYLSFPLTDKETIPNGFVVEEVDGVPPVYGLEFPFRPNYGLRVGVGLNIELGRLTIQLDGRYLAGFNDLIRTGDSQAAVSRRQGIGGHAGFFFAL